MCVVCERKRDVGVLCVSVCVCVSVSIRECLCVTNTRSKKLKLKKLKNTTRTRATGYPALIGRTGHRPLAVPAARRAWLEGKSS